MNLSPKFFHHLRKFNFWLLVVFAATTPFSLGNIQLNSLIIILLLINSIALYVSQKEKKGIEIKVILIFSFIFYVMHIIGLLNSNNHDQGLFDLEKKSSLIAFPFIIFFSPRLEIKEAKIVLISFVVSCLLTMIFCLLVATNRYVSCGDSSFFFYHNLSNIADMHASYLAMYILFAGTILLFTYESEIKNYDRKYQLVYYATFIIFTLSIVLLSGRLHIAILLLGVMVYLSVLFKRKYGWIKSTIAGILMGMLICILAFLVPKNRERFEDAINYDKNRWGEKQMRALIWRCAIELIEANPVTGVGTGDVQDELEKCYKSNDYTSLTYWTGVRFNAHNQFLETAIGIGIFGSIVLLSGFAIAIRYAVKHQNMLYFIFLMISILSCMTESMLERQKGIVFFSFFNSLLPIYFNRSRPKCLRKSEVE